MKEKKLMIFLQKILENSNGAKIEGGLNELRRILIEQKISPHLIKLVDDVIYSVPEASKIAMNQMIDEEAIEIAKQRAAARKEREKQMNSYRGCR